MPAPVTPLPFEEVHKQELQALADRRRKWRPRANPDDPEPTPDSVRNTSLGICFSGGGIRTATFNLGILQGLAKKGLLPLADYLSTVSGGGYIGGWFHALNKRKAWKNPSLSHSYLSVEDYLAEEASHPANSQYDPITFLRKYSNYLAPQLGLLSPDTWVILSIWLRNTILNQTVFILAIAAALLMPLVLGNTAMLLRPLPQWPWWIAGVLVFVVMVYVVFRMSRNLKSIVQQEFPTKRHTRGKSPDTDTSIWLSLVAPIFLTAFLLSLIRSVGRFSPFHYLPTALGMAIPLLILFAVSLSTGGFPICYKNRVRSGKGEKPLGLLIVLVCTAVTWLLLAGAGNLLPAGGHRLDVWNCMAWGPPLFVLALSGGVVLQIGLMGVDYSDSAREWYSRLGANLMIVSCGWIVAFALSVFAPILVVWFLFTWTKTGVGAIVTWLATTFGGLKAASSSSTAGKAPAGGPAPKTPSISLEMLAKYGPPVAIAGFLIAISTASFYAIEKAWPRHEAVERHREIERHKEIARLATSKPGDPDERTCCCCDNKLTTAPAKPGLWESLKADSLDYSALHLSLTNDLIVLSAALALFLLSQLLSLRFNINEFSMNHFYKNRLVRCYLGASHGTEGRHPNPFTGFDPQDDILLTDLAPGDTYDGPLAIVNCALNLNHGKELAWQERKADSFFFTPLYCGYRPAREGTQAGFMPTAEFTGHGGPHIGLATAISGAAANPNGGYHTSAITAFLMAIFNVRLGWWVGNTKNAKYATKFGPGSALMYLFAEMFGITDEDSNFVNLSDGGHFENLGVYELIRRKCRYIIVGDGEQDGEYVFESLGGIIRKARIDFGAEITISPRRIFPSNGLSTVHCATGNIVYSDGTTAKILYLKASLTGDEPYDVEQYKKANQDFPQQSTSNQFFTESQFESYRALGRHVVEATFDRIPRPGTHADLADLFHRLGERWVPPVSSGPGVFTRHAAAYTSLVQQLNSDPDLRFLDSELLPGFPPAQTEPSEHSPEMRRAKLFLVGFIRLMEEVYIDLNLEDESQFNHEQNRGWVVLFKMWAKPGTRLHALMQSIGTTYGTSFQRFFDKLSS